MQLDKALSHVAVVGAAGKMGSGIALLLLKEMARLEADHFGIVDGSGYRLVLVDCNEEALQKLQRYLQKFLIRYAEKNINSLRQYFATNPNLVSNEEVIAAFVDGAFNIVRLETDPASARDAHIVFEAASEDVDLKASLIAKIKSDKKQFFFTNTSSIPIHVLRKKAGVDGCLIGVHFYNPPSVQRLIELIAPKNTLPEAKQLALDFANHFDKIVVESADVAGFIGNGHFIREVLFSCRQVAELSKSIPLEEAIYLINTITGDYLIRPMGIFQLVDFVGVDIVASIMETMRHYQHEENFSCDLIANLIDIGAVGGVTKEGSIKNGFFQYEQNKIVGILKPDEGTYRAFNQWSEDVKSALGPMPANYLPWKTLVNDLDRQAKIEAYFDSLFSSATPGSEVTMDYLLNSRDILTQLVRDGVAKSADDVNSVLMHGFYHLYGADIPWFDFAHVLRGNICDV